MLQISSSFTFAVVTAQHLYAMPFLALHLQSGLQTVL